MGVLLIKHKVAKRELECAIFNSTSYSHLAEMGKLENCQMLIRISNA